MIKNAITYETSGRLGNQLQLYACARTLSLRYDWDFIYQPLVHEKELNLYDRYGQKISDLLRNYFRKKVVLDHHEWDTTFNINGAMENSYLEKQNTLYILKWGGIFKDLSEFRNSLIKEIIPEQFLNIETTFPKNHIAVHVRRDDSDYPLPIQYYVDAVNITRRKANNINLHLFSDGDRNAISSQLSEKLRDVRITIHKNTAVRDMINMSNFQTIIISMSWFSYWAAFLSNNAKVLAPDDFCYYPHWESVNSGSATS